MVMVVQMTPQTIQTLDRVLGVSHGVKVGQALLPEDIILEDTELG